MSAGAVGTLLGAKVVKEKIRLDKFDGEVSQEDIDAGRVKPVETIERERLTATGELLSEKHIVNGVVVKDWKKEQANGVD